MKNAFLLLLCILCFSSCTKHEQKPDILVLTEQKPSVGETEAMKKALSPECRFIKLVSLQQLKEDPDLLNAYDILWYHRHDSSDIYPEEERLGEPVSKWVSEGGKLVLSLDAVRLLNAWAIEPSPIEPSTFMVVDQGFGRKRGFHAYHQHPLFSGLHGGAYIWNPNSDQYCRTLGFRKGVLPAAKGSKVIGIDWAYITYHEDDKLVWQTPVGKGTVLAIGGYMHFADDNRNQPHLERFTQNCISYLVSGDSEEEACYWDYSPLEICNDLKLPEGKKPPVATLWQWPEASLSIGHTCPEGRVPYDLSGNQLTLMGNESGGIEEFWSHPFMAFRDIHTAVIMPEGESPVWLNQCKPEVKKSPGRMMRTYTIKDLQLQEIIVVDYKSASAVVHYQWSSGNDFKLQVTSASNLRQMWPYSQRSTGSLHYAWSGSMQAMAVVNTDKRYASFIGFSQKPASHTEGQYLKPEPGKYTSRLKPSADHLVRGLWEFPCPKEGALDIYLVTGMSGPEKLISDYERLTENPESLLDACEANYRQERALQPEIISPDTLFNEGFRWAQTSDHEFFIKTEGIGLSLMAGYATSNHGWDGNQKISGRPGYGWYFGRDAAWSGMALLRDGNYEKVRDILLTMGKYQDITGKIYHELTTTGSVHYDASDATPLYVVLAGLYLETTGDMEFITSQWPHIRKAMDFCYSTDTDDDGLIENTMVGHGWIEGGALLGAKTSFYLAALWTECLYQASFLANATGNKELSRKYGTDAARVQAILNRDYWSEEYNYFYFGKFPDNTYRSVKTVFPAIPAFWGLLDEDKAGIVAALLSSNEFTTEWGVRILSSKNPLFNPSGYHYGSIYPLFTGWSSLAQYKTGRPVQGFSQLYGSLQNYMHWNMGHIEEVLHGQNYVPSGVCSHQCWSESMVVLPVLEGMMGLRANPAQNSLQLSPAIPFNWDSLKVNNIRFGNERINYSFHRANGKIHIRMSTTSGREVFINYRHYLPAGTSVESVMLNNKPFDWELAEGDPYPLFCTRIPLNPNGITELVIGYDGGIGAVPPKFMAEISKPTGHSRIICEKFQENEYTLYTEGESGQSHFFYLYAENKPDTVIGASISCLGNKMYLLQAQYPEDVPSENIQTKKIVLKTR